SHRLLSKKAESCDLDTAPTFCASTVPFLNRMRVGIPRMPNLGGVWGFSSMLSFATLMRSLYSLAISSRIGAIILQGPHHSAQKSRSTGFSDLSTSWENVASVVCTMCGLLTRLNLRAKKQSLCWIGRSRSVVRRDGGSHWESSCQRHPSNGYTTRCLKPL